MRCGLSRRRSLARGRGTQRIRTPAEGLRRSERCPLALRRDRPRPTDARTPGRRKRGTREVPEASTIAEAGLRESLKAWRSAQAKDNGVPAYVVFNDATLFELARLRPTDQDALLDITGIGPVKIERYGDDILALVEAALGND